MPFFSVIIPTFNRSAFLRRAVESVLVQNFSDFELLIIDDGSTDDTREMLDSFGNKIKYLYQTNSGVSSARNLGIKESSGNHIAFLDSDDTWHIDKLSSHFNFINLKNNIRIHQTEDIWIRNGKRVNPKNKYERVEGDIFKESLANCTISASSVVIERSIFNDYGKFDENMLSCEDYDLWLRITAFEKIGLIQKKLTTRYGGHEDQLSFKYWGMDRFRLYSILKLLNEKNKQLNEEQNKYALISAIKKAEILKSGALKRNNSELSDLLEMILLNLKSGKYMQIDCQNLLA